MGCREGNIILVMAGNMRQAQQWATWHGLSGADWVYGGAAENFVGCHFNRFAIVGTFWDRDDASQIYRYMQTRLNPNAEEVR